MRDPRSGLPVWQAGLLSTSHRCGGPRKVHGPGLSSGSLLRASGWNLHCEIMYPTLDLRTAQTVRKQLSGVLSMRMEVISSSGSPESLTPSH